MVQNERMRASDGDVGRIAKCRFVSLGGRESRSISVSY